MATIDSEWERLGFLRGQGRGTEKVHVVFIEEEAKARVENLGDKPKTQFRLETDSPEMYSRLNAQKDRWLRLANKSVALDAMCRLWEEVSDQAIKEFCEGA